MSSAVWKKHGGQGVFVPLRYLLALLQLIFNGITYRYPEVLLVLAG
ncbi:unnamed protein product [Amoebophrya sp. A25]|nr:unnamed protein product [Amoebophrya sp. A25]|eukprot:GSA25T00025471001.1